MKDNQQEEKIKSGDLDYISDSKAAVLQQSPRIAWITLVVIALVVLVGVLWAAVATVPVLTVGNGKVITSSKLQVIQNFEGGIIKDINVSVGDIVKKGQVLIRLDKTRFSSAYKEELTKINVLKARMARLTAEVEGKKKIQFPEEILRDHPELVKSETRLFKSRQFVLNEKLKILRNNFRLTKKELNIIAPLVKKGVMSRLDQIRLERDLNGINGQILERVNKARNDAQNELNKVKSELAVLNEALTASLDRMQRTVIRSPVNGVVNKIYVTTIGQVVKPGMSIIEIVPHDENLIIEARIRPSDIAFVHLKQKAVIKVGAYDPSIYGSLDAVVTNIGADTLTDKDGTTYYEVMLKTDKNFLGTKAQPLPIIPGMTVTVNITTGEKSVLSYVLKPFLKAKSKALRER